ncbi:hypothetical protein M9H77_12822 [Catharanthus roseus]|uniref:Uncharacterized protein n=1 Tax=Catharanthus roseus TaxID=4058 RepID=A0ACC0BIQ0_CATRO|nr:hypothetical protein M9H77_12822 [Catharanthus roseus]
MEPVDIVGSNKEYSSLPEALNFRFQGMDCLKYDNCNDGGLTPTVRYLVMTMSSNECWHVPDFTHGELKDKMYFCIRFASTEIIFIKGRFEKISLLSFLPLNCFLFSGLIRVELK